MALEVGTIEFFIKDWEKRTPTDMDRAFAIDVLSRIEAGEGSVEEIARKMGLPLGYVQWLTQMDRWPS